MDEDKAVKVLQQLTPALILGSEKLRSSFESFLCRGTAAERKQLFLLDTHPDLPAEHDTTASSSQVTFKRQGRRRQTKCGPKDWVFSEILDSSKLKASQPLSSFAASSNHSSQPHETEELDLTEAHTYVRETGSKDPHPRNFVSVAISYVSPVANPVDGLENFQIYCDVFSKGKSRFSHLYYGHQQTQKAGVMFSCLS